MQCVYTAGVAMPGGGLGNFSMNTALQIYKHHALKHLYCMAHRQIGIDESKITDAPLGKALNKLPSPLHSLKDNIFDSVTSARVEKSDVCHGISNQFLYTARKAKKLGAKTFLDRPSSHTFFQKKIVEQEYAKFGVREKAVDDWHVRKTLKEYDEVDRICVPSRFAYDTFVKNGVPEEKLVLNQFGVDLKKFSPAARKKTSCFRVLFNGHVSLRKGVQYLLEAWKTLGLANAELCLNGPVFKHAKPLLQKYSGQASLTRFVPDIVNYYRSADVLVLPSLEEGSALVIYEAMACGTPVIVSENTGHPGVVNGKHGFVVPIRDPKAIASRIKYLYDNPGERARMGKAARKHIEKYSWDKYGDRLIKAYRAALYE